MDLSALLNTMDAWFAAWVVTPITWVIFFDLAFWTDEITLPIVVVWLLLGAAFFTVRFQFVNLRAFRHAIDCVRGRYTRPDETGEISHFQALSAALSGTVGLGNIAGVAVAIGLGGPGAVFWMVIAGILGMSSKFAECTLGQKYRIVRDDGRVTGGGMIYLRAGLAELGYPKFGRVLAAVFAVMCIGGSFGGGNMFQSNQSFAQFANVFPSAANDLGAVLFGGALVVVVGLVIIGGIRRIGEVAGFLVPIMCTLYVVTGLVILALNAGELGHALGVIVNDAFAPTAVAGGFVGSMIQGFRRAAFSNEAGTGSAAIAHSAATTDEPVREGMVALLEPFIDTLVVCLMTGLVIVVTGAHTAADAGSGIAMTSWAFSSVFPWFQYVLSVTAILFAFSTMITWCYYGEQSWSVLFAGRGLLIYKIIFLGFSWAGAVFTATAVIDFGDMMILGMAFPNIVGVVMLSGKVKADLDDYWARLKSGEIQPVDAV